MANIQLAKNLLYLRTLYNSRVNINMISTSEIRITVLVPEEDIEKAMNAVHDGFGLGA